MSDPIKLNFDTNWEYATAPEDIGQIQLEETYGHYINGTFIEPKDCDYMDSINPANGELLAKVAIASAEDVDRAVQAAEDAREAWSSLDGSVRGRYLFRLARQIQERSRELAVIESLDGGKPIRESRDIDLPLVAQHFFYHAGWADKIELIAPNGKPVGVVGQIIPWNFPLLMAAWKLAPALACGNTAVLKPAESTPLSALFLAKIIHDCGFPPGVINIVQGPGSVGQEIVNHPMVSKIAFTGSTAVGKSIQKAVAGTGKRLTLELGGKGANIVFEDAALDQAVEGIVNGIFFNQGHVCCAGSRLLVQESVYDRLLRKLKDRISTLIVGDPLDKNTDVGAINSRAQLERIQYFVSKGLEEGGEIWSAPCELPKAGNWMAPTLFTGVSQSHQIVKEEIFGPVLTIQSFRTIDEAVEKANNTEYGLSAGIWTQKGAKIFEVSKRLRAGVVWANTFNKFDAASPFGGYKESGYGREGGAHGLKEYMEVEDQY
jgi:aldehyde dehydrogenase (NAD+)